jgi:hypothetical protein
MPGRDETFLVDMLDAAHLIHAGKYIMLTLITIVLFLLGMCISVQALAAFYRIIDLWYTIHTAYLKVIQGILGWVGISFIIAVLLGDHWRRAFLWGLVLYVPFYLLNFMLIQAIIRHR